MEKEDETNMKRCKDERRGEMDTDIGWTVNWIDLVTAGGIEPYAFKVCLVVCNGGVQRCMRITRRSP